MLGGFLRRMIIALDRGDLAKLPFSDDVRADSRLLMRRSLRDRVETLAGRLGRGPAGFQRGVRYATERVLDLRQPRRDRPDAADGDARLGDGAPGDVGHQQRGDADRGPLVQAELQIRGGRPRRRQRDLDVGEDLVGAERALVGTYQEVGQGQPPRPGAAVQHDARLVDQQRGRRIGVRLGEAEVAAERADGAHARVGDLALHVGQHREVRTEQWRALQRAMGDGRADHERSTVGRQRKRVEPADRLDVDQVLESAQALLHRQQQLAAARVERG